MVRFFFLKKRLKKMENKITFSQGFLLQYARSKKYLKFRQLAHICPRRFAWLGQVGTEEWRIDSGKLDEGILRQVNKTRNHKVRVRESFGRA